MRVRLMANKPKGRRRRGEGSPRAFVRLVRIDPCAVKALFIRFKREVGRNITRLDNHCTITE